MMQCVATVLIVLCGFLMFSHAKENLCPGDKASCPYDSTCCVLSNGSFGCCPIQNAVCCGDSVHCCPDGYTCDVMKGICKMGRKLVPLLMKFPVKPTMKIPAVKESVFESTSCGPVCPNKTYQCPKEDTRCKRPFGKYGCSLSKNSCCCSDHKHCCPEGYTCDVEAGKCHKTAEHINMVENMPAVKTSIAGKYIKGFQTKEMLQKPSAQKTEILAALNPANRICRDGTRCADTKTCCRVRRGGYGCCRFYPAVCCSDLIHCCPSGFTCSYGGLICFKPTLAKIPF